MPVTIVKEGDKDKQGNARCPKCGEIVLIEELWGDTPRCGKCSIPYEPNYEPISYH